MLGWRTISPPGKNMIEICRMKKEPIPHSDTLRQAKALPETVCVNCPNAVWHLTRSENQKEELRIFCLLMHALIAEPLIACEGTKIYPNP